jgi:DNA-binding NarL/FixJ family response regulator
MTGKQKSVALIADDHSLYRVGLALLLKDQLGFDTVIEARGFDEALDRLADTPDIRLALFDLSMPGMGGPQSLAVVRSSYPDVRVAVVSGSEAREHVAQTVAAGLHGFVPKSLVEVEMVSAIREVVQGRTYMPRSAVLEAASVSARASRTVPGRADGDKGAPGKTATLEGLTPRQRDVLGGIVRGLANKEIARELDIAEGTVKIHLAALFVHFDVRNRTELATRTQRLFGG